MTTVSGRPEPLPDPCPDPRLWLIGLASGQVRAECVSGDWARTLDPKHLVEDFVRLEAMHGRAS